MQKKQQQLVVAQSSDPRRLDCRVVVESSQIDFLERAAVFAAGSGSDCGCGAVLPTDEPARREKHRRKVR